jgi:hypothetical protein
MTRKGTDSGTAEEWRISPRGIYCDRRKRHLLVEFLKPRGEERVLSVGSSGSAVADCLRKKGCCVTQWVPRETLSPRGISGWRETGDVAGTDHFGELPFSDSEFDIVAVTDCLPLFDHPEGIIREAVRVGRERVFIGISNRLSLHVTPPDPSNGPSPQGGKRRKVFGPGGILRAIGKALPGAKVRWGSVLYFPYRWYMACSEIEERMPVNGNPFGFCLGFTFPVFYAFRSLQELIRDRGLADWKPEGGIWEEVRRADTTGRDRDGFAISP